MKMLAEFMDGDDIIQTPFRMLIAEDESLVRELLREMISIAFPDVQIDFADDGFEALDMLARRDYDFLLSDVSMPGMNGIQAAAEALRYNPDLWVAGMSGNTWGREAFVSAEGVGRLALFFLDKPFLFEELRTVVGIVIEYRMKYRCTRHACLQRNGRLDARCLRDLARIGDEIRAALGPLSIPGTP